MNFINRIKFPAVLLWVAVAFFFAQCTKDDGTDTMTGTATVKMTDAPVDDPSVQAVFVTVADVKIDGQSWDGFNGRQTIEISSLQNGQTEVLGTGELEAKSYQEVTIVLDYDADESGNSPGCYVLTTDNVKHDLANSTNSNFELDAMGDFDIDENENKSLVVDFDLRKAIKRESSQSDKYSFVTDSELRTSMRTVVEGNAGRINGTVSGTLTSNDYDKVVVYAYKKGEYSSSETNAQGSSNIRFKNAETSTVAAANGSYTLAFLPEGEYDVYFAGYKDNSTTNETAYAGRLNVNVLGSLSILGVNVDANSSTTLNVNILGLL